MSAHRQRMAAQMQGAVTPPKPTSTEQMAPGEIYRPPTWDLRIRNHPVTRFLAMLVAIVSAMVLVVSGVMLIVEAQARQEQREDIRRSQIDRAYATLARKGRGNTGKGEALTYLFNNSTTIDGIDVSCANVGAVDDEGKCTSAPILTGLKLVAPQRELIIPDTWPGKIDATVEQKKRSGPRRLMFWNLSGASIRDAHIEYVSLEGAQVRNTLMDRMFAKGLVFDEGAMSDMACIDCVFVDSHIQMDSTHNFYGIVSGGNLEIVVGSDQPMPEALIEATSGLAFDADNLPNVSLLAPNMKMDGLELALPYFVRKRDVDAADLQALWSKARMCRWPGQEPPSAPARVVYPDAPEPWRYGFRGPAAHSEDIENWVCAGSPSPAFFDLARRLREGKVS